MATPTVQRETTVIIAGSGLTGLSLALMLQDLGVPYLLLEAYDSLTPNVGASIALQPQGLRIYHQLGLLQDIEAIYQPITNMKSVDGETGRVHLINYAPIARERHGYDIGFFNRYDLLCVLHKHVRDKERLLVNQKVVRIDNHDDKVVVHTAAGDVFEAQVMVGADGVRSTVREEMWRNAEAASAVVPAEDKKEITCDWATCFGVSTYGASMPRGEVGSVVGDGYNAGWMFGKDGRCFTFWTFRLPKEARKVTHGSIPRFTHEQHEREIARGKRMLARVSRKHGLHIDFDELYDHRDPAHCGITALPHFALKKWHFGRIVVIGDSAHKFNPLPGQGGMNCLVSAAALVNCLQDALGDRLRGSPAWDMAPLGEAFTRLARERADEVASGVELSEDAMNLMGWGSGYQRIRYKVLVPLLPASAHADGATKMIRAGSALRGPWALPDVSHSVMYADEELHVRAGGRAPAGLPPAALLLLAAAVAAAGGIMAMRAVQKQPGLFAGGWRCLQSLAA